MRVVSEQSEQDIRKRKARDALVYPLRELAANLLRTIRGAGKPLELWRQMESYVSLMREYTDAHGCQPDDQFIHDILDCDIAENDYRPWIEQNRTKEDLRRSKANGTIDRKDAERLIRNASLQIIASTLVDQLTQRRTGEKILEKGCACSETRKKN
jgi:hypothetical protein